MSRLHIANTLRRLRERAGLTIYQVGDMVGMSPKTVSGWENNRSQPNVETLMLLCDIYGVEDVLAEFREDIKKEPAENGGRLKIMKEINAAVNGLTDEKLEQVRRVLRALID